jgi:hypothetical protein
MLPNRGGRGEWHRFCTAEIISAFHANPLPMANPPAARHLPVLARLAAIENLTVMPASRPPVGSAAKPGFLIGQTFAYLSGRCAVHDVPGRQRLERYPRMLSKLRPMVVGEIIAPGLADLGPFTSLASPV